jgi:heptaprenylglyceryl phosphate synthase
MTITDIIRSILVKLEKIEQIDDNYPVQEPGEQGSRFKHIYAMLDKEHKHVANAPNEKYADVDAVTVDAGGGVNGPKHPHDIRVKDPSAYPNQQEY